MGTSVRFCFSSCHTIAFSADMDFVRLVSFQLRLPVIQHWAAEKLQAFYFLFFLPGWKREESPIFKSSQFISCSSLHLHVSQPCYNSFLLSLLPRSCSTAPGVSLIPTALHNLHLTELYGSHLTAVIWRHNRLFISVAEMASRCCFYDTFRECSNSQTGREILTWMARHKISSGGSSLF